LLVTEKLTPEQARKLRADYNFILNMARNDDTGSLVEFWGELRKFIRASKGNTAKINAFVNRELPKRAYFAGMTGAQIEAQIEEAKPELAPDVERAIEKQRNIVQQLAEQYGVTLPEDQVRSIAEDARRNNLSQFEIAVKVRPLLEQAIAEGQDLTGTTGDAEVELQRWASSNGLQLSREASSRYLSMIATGRQSVDDVKNDLRKTYLAGMYPAWAEKINQGLDPEVLFEPYRDSARRLLEVDDLGLDDPIMKRAAQYVGQDGKPSQLPLYQFEQEIRKDPRWQYTDNAYSSYMNVGTDLLRMFGLR
jgi:hypothetical protein